MRLGWILSAPQMPLRPARTRTDRTSAPWLTRIIQLMRIFDCFLYNGEIDVLLLRLHELHEVVDTFVVIEATKTFSGNAKHLTLRARWSRVKRFAGKIRYVMVTDDIESGDAWARERFQRNSIQRGLEDAADTDLVCVSDVDEIPRAAVIRRIRGEEPRVLGFRLLLSYFFLNYRNVAGPEANDAPCCAFPKDALRQHTPDQLRHGIRTGAIPAELIDDAGWHFSYLADLDGVKRKIAAFSHQEFNTPMFLNSINIEETVRHRRDFYSRADYAWDIVGIEDLPSMVRSKPKRYAHLLLDCDDQTSGADTEQKWWHPVVRFFR
jgi:Glycosyltransferase family 17